MDMIWQSTHNASCCDSNLLLFQLGTWIESILMLDSDSSLFLIWKRNESMGPF